MSHKLVSGLSQEDANIEFPGLVDELELENFVSRFNLGVNALVVLRRSQFLLDLSHRDFDELSGRVGGVDSSSELECVGAEPVFVDSGLRELELNQALLNYASRED